MELRRGEAGGLYYLELVPEGTTAALPLLVGLHGRGAAAEDLGGVCMQLDSQRYRYILLYAPLVEVLGDGIRYRWFDRERQAETVPAARERVIAALRALWDRYHVEPRRTGLFGFSQGGVLTLDVGLHLPPEQALAGLACLSGRLFATDDLDAALARHRDQALLIVHGTRDDRIAVEEARATRQRLEAAGLRPEYHEFPMAHEVTRDSLAAVRAFFHRVLP
ncbi:MAG TPA: PHB depolymerase family esterase [Chloroflexota bacterium]|jgi:phospholipase/carboxylesterase|nr:PHB depolymerase family esterase [Chloroflexota bacterium]